MILSSRRREENASPLLLSKAARTVPVHQSPMVLSAQLRTTSWLNKDHGCSRTLSGNTESQREVFLKVLSDLESAIVLLAKKRAFIPCQHVATAWDDDPGSADWIWAEGCSSAVWRAGGCSRPSCGPRTPRVYADFLRAQGDEVGQR